MDREYLQKLGIFMANGIIAMYFTIIAITIYHFKEFEVLVPLWILFWILTYQFNFWEIKYI